MKLARRCRTEELLIEAERTEAGADSSDDHSDGSPQTAEEDKSDITSGEKTSGTSRTRRLREMTARNRMILEVDRRKM